MRVIVVYRNNADYTRTTDDFLRDFNMQTGHYLEVINPDNANSVSFCETYDITQYPTIIALSDDGQVQNSWSGLPLPTISEVSYYAQ